MSATVPPPPPPSSAATPRVPAGAGDGESSPRRGPWRRRRAGRLVAGVATGLADHLGVDVVLVRIIIVLVTVLTNGLGLVAYVIAAALVPEGHHDAAATGDRRWGPVPTTGADVEQGAGRDPVFWVGLAALVLGAVWLLGGGLGAISLGPLMLGRDVILAVLLIGLGLALWRSADRPRTTVPPRPAASSGTPAAGLVPPPPVIPVPGPTTSPTTTSPTTTSPTTTASSHDQESIMPPTDTIDAPTGPAGPDPVGSSAAGVGGADTAPPPPAAPAPPTPAWEPPPLPERPRSLLGQLTSGLALVTAGTLWALELAGVVELGTTRILAAALLVLGLGLLVGSVAGRARWLLIPALVLMPVVIASSLLGTVTLVGLEEGIGERRPTPVAVSELSSSYQLAIGSLTLDLTQLDPDELAASAAAGEPVVIDVQVGLGEVLVLVPDDLQVRADARAGLGGVVVFAPTGDGRRSADGVGPSVSSTFEPADAVAEVQIDVQLGIGYGEVQLVPAP